MPSVRLFLSVALIALCTSGCREDAETQAGPIAPEPRAAVDGPATPSPLETVNTPEGDLTIWPFTGTDVIGTPSDPINLILVGQTDLRALRAALLFLDGDRSGFPFPGGYPFDCTWKDAIGGTQTAYSAGSGWSGSAVQLECGDYQPLRFHLRLFDAGAFALASAHFETLIPGTTDHQVLNWELAEQLVTADFIRTGLLDAVTPVGVSGPLHPAPYRDIPAVIYNGLPASLRLLAGGPPGDVGAPVPLLTDGAASIVHVSGTATVEMGVARQEVAVQFDQVIPKPFCVAGPGDFLYVNGPVDFVQTVRLTPAGLRSLLRVSGTLDLTPVNPATMPPTPIGDTYSAQVRQTAAAAVTDQGSLVSDFGLQLELPPGGPYRGRLVSRLKVGPGAASFSELRIECGE